MTELTTLLSQKADLSALESEAQHAENRALTSDVQAQIADLSSRVVDALVIASPEALVDARTAAKVAAQAFKNADSAASGARLDHQDGLTTEEAWLALNRLASLAGARSDAWDIIRGYRG